jgi:hypothetical protein
MIRHAELPLIERGAALIMLTRRAGAMPDDRISRSPLADFGR